MGEERRTEILQRRETGRFPAQPVRAASGLMRRKGVDFSVLTNCWEKGMKGG